MTVPDTLTRTGRAVTARVAQVDRSAWAARLRLALIRFWQWLQVAAVVTGRYLAVAVMMLRVDLGWSSWADETGVARWRTTYRTRFERDHDGRRRRTERPHHRLEGVPKIKRWRLGQHHATVVIKIPGRHDLDSLAPAVQGPLRHRARAQRVTIREVCPGQAAIDLLRRDPLERVMLVPRAVGPDRFRVARDEYGRSRAIDLAAIPHLLFNGNTGSGKSSMVNTLAGAMVPTSDLMCSVDLKFGLEAQVLGNRWSEVAVTSKEAAALFDKIEAAVGHRARLLAWLLCQDVGQVQQRYGIRLRRVRLFVDEVAELDNDALEKLERLVSTVRALGFSIIVAGQRFGSDQGKKVTSIRAQLAGRIVGGVLDTETARMAFPGADEDTRNQVLNLRRPGMALVQLDDTPKLWRFPYQGMSTLRPLGQVHADKALSLDALAAEDERITAGLVPTVQTAQERG